MNDSIENAQKNLAETLQSLLEEKEMLAKVVEFFPYPIQIFSLDGTAVMINKAALDMIGIRSVESHVGKYNCFRDPVVRKLGFMDQLREVLAGRTVHLTDFNAPYQDLVRYFNVTDRDIETISSDITCFPLVNTDGKMEYFAAIFIFKKIYKGKEEISLGKQYIKDHWREPFDLAATAKAACLSKAQFIKLFKKHTGLTLHEYYINYKISKLKEILLNTDLAIAQAFAACNMDYNGYSTKLFRKKVGVSPSEYRKMSLQNQL